MTTNLEQYASMMASLRDMIDKGQGDGDEADKLRDDMDVVWFRMSEEEKVQARGREPVSTPVIDKFDGDYRWLSNFWPCEVELDGQKYPSVEHAYQAAKTTDTAVRKTIRDAPTAGKAKRLGKTVSLRSDWDSIKLDVMEHLLRQKFAMGTLLASKLLQTGEAKLVEGNTWGDVFFGVCKGKGLNHLGELLMKIRADVRKQRSATYFLDEGSSHVLDIGIG